MNDSERRLRFREALEARRGLLLPGAFNALSARIVQDTGCEAVYLTGAGLTNMRLGLPDLAFVGLTDVADEVMRMRQVIDVPLMVDADTGFGNAVNLWRAVKVLERAGADAIQIEDQTFPKRCGHFAGKDVAPLPEMVAKVKAAVDARTDPNLLIVARTDAAAVEGFEAAVHRALALAEAGADILFVEAVRGEDEVRRLPALLTRPALINIVIGGQTPVLPASELATCGYGCVLYANAALQGAVRGMQEALGVLRSTGRLDEDAALVIPFAERQRLVDKPFFDELEVRYA